jgi:hypothetical protein
MAQTDQEFAQSLLDQIVMFCCYGNEEAEKAVLAPWVLDSITRMITERTEAVKAEIHEEVRTKLKDPYAVLIHILRGDIDASTYRQRIRENTLVEAATILDQTSLFTMNSKNTIAAAKAALLSLVIEKTGDPFSSLA